MFCAKSAIENMIRIIELKNEHESKVYLIDDKKIIYKLDCRCGDFTYRRIKQLGQFSDIKTYEIPCKHLKEIVEVLEKQGYILKKPKPMTGTDKCTAELRRFLIERAKGLCECGCGKPGEEVHRKTARTNGGKYNEWNCVFLNGECHKRITYQSWHSSPGAKKSKLNKNGGEKCLDSKRR